MNFPGSFAWSASATFRFQTVPAISGAMSALTGGPLAERVDGVEGDPLHLFLRLGLQDERLRLRGAC